MDAGSFAFLYKIGGDEGVHAYRVAICDDEIVTCSDIEDLLIDYGSRKELAIVTEVFYSGDQLLSYLEKGERFDLIFLDIELENINGVEAGRILREEKDDNVTQVVYISSKENYCMQLFAVRPLHFLIKPIGSKEIESIMDLYIKLYGDKNVFFEYQVGKQTYRIAQKEILYFRSNARKIEMVTVNGEKEFYGRMQDVEKQLDRSRFWCVHKSYIINTQYISEYRFNQIILTSKDVIPVSQAYRSTVRNKIMELQIAGRD